MAVWHNSNFSTGLMCLCTLAYTSLARTHKDGATSHKCQRHRAHQAHEHSTGDAGVSGSPTLPT